MIEHSPSYVSDHWCIKGHVIFCTKGAMDTRLKDGRVLEVRKSMSYQVADDAEAHSPRTRTGATLFILD
nr:DHCW motif cupin fold protein [Citreicella sp. C3M06]